jgi:hypothetical protein
VQVPLTRARTWLAGPPADTTMLVGKRTLWPAFAVRLPHGLVNMHNGVRQLAIDYLLVMHDADAIWFNTLTIDTHWGYSSAVVDMAFSHELTQTGDAARVLGWLWRVVVGLEETLRNPRLFTSPLGEPGDDPLKVERPRIYQVADLTLS